MIGNLEMKLKESETKRRDQSIKRTYNADYQKSAYKILEPVYIKYVGDVFIP